MPPEDKILILTKALADVVEPARRVCIDLMTAGIDSPDVMALKDAIERLDKMINVGNGQKAR